MAQQQLPYPRGFGEEEEWEIERFGLPERMEIEDEPEESIEEQFAHNPQYFRYLLYQGDDNEEEVEDLQPREEAADDPPAAEEPQDEENENWEGAGNPIRFYLRLGFIVDDYDSGIDEPNERHEPYNQFFESLQYARIDEENQQLEEFLLNQHSRHRPEDQE